MQSLPFLFFAAGLFTSTWDRFANIDFGGPNLKAHQLFFLLSLASCYLTYGRRDMAGFVRPLFRPFPLCFLLLGFYYLGLSPWSHYPLKSFLYSGWLLFDILVIWLPAQELTRRVAPERFLQVAWGTLIFLAAVILGDQVAYQFGHTGGLLGYNQDIDLQWGVSRPHAFSYEPSYIACFLCLGLLATGEQLFQTAKKRALFLASAAFVMLALVATTSRSGWAALGLGLCGLFVLPLLLGERKLPRAPLLLLAILASSVGVFYLTTPSSQRAVMGKELVTPVLEGRDGSGGARLRAHLLALRIARETNWIGAGLGASYAYSITHIGPDIDNHGRVKPARFGSEAIMSTWGQLLAEGGIPALLLYAGAALSLVLAILKAWRRERQPYLLGSACAAFLFFAFLSFWLGGLARGDVWVWYALWSGFAQGREPA